jgi:hypothetical protein
MAKTNFEEESKLHLLEAYIESGSTKHLSDVDVEYLDVLCKMNSMRRKYGQNETIKFFTRAPYSISSYRAKQMFYECIQLFYATEQADKQALRNLKAEQLEAAAELVLASAQSPKDMEIYGNLIVQSAKMRQLDADEPISLPIEAFKRHIKVYSLDPRTVKIDVADRNELSRIIDELAIPESDKRRVKADGLIEDVDFIEILNEQKKDNSKK